MQTNDPIYAIQGLYRKKWSTKWTASTMAQAVNIYKGKKYRDMKFPGYETDWRIINIETEEVIPSPELHVPVRLPGHKIKTIPCTDSEFHNSIYYETYFHEMRNDGTLVYMFGYTHSQGIIAYKMTDGSHRISPQIWRPGDE